MKYVFIVLLLSSSFLFYSCSNERQEVENFVAEVNDYKIDFEDFKYQMARELEYNDDFKVTHTAKKEFLESLIRKEIFIQEAKKLDLDTREKFIKAIERYWEATLIRDLVDIKSKDIVSKIVISEEEIEMYYQNKYGGDNTLSDPHVRERIIARLREEKKSSELETWYEDLREKSRIIINEEVLYKN